METFAKLTNSPYSPRKMRLLADMVRGMRADKAMYLLKVHDKKAYAAQMGKVLKSAISNWQQANDGRSVEDGDLYVKRIQVDGARMLKRVQPAPQGRANRIRKRYNHITVVVDQMQEAAE